MNSIFIIAHAPLASALRSAVLHVFADQGDSIAALDVLPHVAAEETHAVADIVLQQLAQSSKCEASLLMTDVFGATPCNVASNLVDGINTKLLTGVNLPMLLRAMTYRHETLQILESRALAGGIQGVMSVANTAPQHQTLKTYDQNNRDHQQ